jgi:hypothetical protein
MSSQEDHTKDYTDEIKSFIIGKAKERNQINGSALGWAIRKEFPVDIKARYGSLRRFIDRYCAEEIKWIGKSGDNDLYTLKSNTESFGPPDNATTSPSRTEESVNSFWKVFNNPKVKEGLILNTSTGDLGIGNDNEPLPEQFIQVEKVTSEEYRRIAFDFLPKLADSKRSEFRQVLSIDDFWPNWSLLVRKYRRQGVFREWLKWRDDKVCEIFQNRLKGQVSEPICEQALRNLRDSLQKAPKPTRSKPSTDRSLDKRDGDLRRIIHAAIDKMSDEELRLIRLPVGIVADLLNQETHNKG